MRSWILVCAVLLVSACAQQPECVIGARSGSYAATCGANPDDPYFPALIEGDVDAPVSLTVGVCDGLPWHRSCGPVNGAAGPGPGCSDEGNVTCPAGSSPSCVRIPCDGVEYSDTNPPPN
ncbi:MAG: hypothetical protein AB7T06_29315 [Kofleriaceae bacterium]